MTFETNSPLSRDLQRELLFCLRQLYPGSHYGLPRISNFSREAIIANLLYLEQHGLCDAGVIKNADGSFSLGSSTITATGLDFLENDGGLSAILGIVTVKIHAETLKELMKAEVERSTASMEEKSFLKRQIDKLPQAALSAATSELVREGIQHVADPVHWIRMLLGV